MELSRRDLLLLAMALDLLKRNAPKHVLLIADLKRRITEVLRGAAS